MTRQPLTVAFHVGVHKTATTHLQKCLKRATPGLVAAGVRYYGPDSFRLPGRTIPALFGLKHSDALAEPRRPPVAQLAIMAKDSHRLLISEENFIGVLNSPKGQAQRRRYKAADRRLAMLAAAIEQPIDVFLAVRRPTDFLNAAYCQMLLGGQIRPLGVFLRRNPLDSVDWVDLVGRIRAAEGVGQVTVWRYEDYGPLFDRIVAAMVGDAAASLVPCIGRRFNASLSAAAVAEVLDRSAMEQVENLAHQARTLLPVADGYPPFDAFTPAAHMASEAAYADQMQTIARMDGVRVLRPAQG